jgi:hypothetical protein
MCEEKERERKKRKRGNGKWVDWHLQKPSRRRSKLPCLQFGLTATLLHVGINVEWRAPEGGGCCASDDDVLLEVDSGLGERVLVDGNDFLV